MGQAAVRTHIAAFSCNYDFFRYFFDNSVDGCWQKHYNLFSRSTSLDMLMTKLLKFFHDINNSYILAYLPKGKDAKPWV